MARPASTATGEEPDFAALRATLVRCVRRAAPRWSDAEIDDLVQTALTRIVARRREVSEDTTYNASYLLKVANHVVVDELRRRGRRPGEPLAPDDAIASPVGDPAARLRAVEIGDGITACLAAMKAERRHAVVLHLEGLSVPEAAALLGGNRKQAENLVYRGLDDLRRCLRGKGLEP